MKILYVVSVLAPDQGGGNAERTNQLAHSTASLGNESTILTTEIGGPFALKTSKVDIVTVPCINQRFQIPMRLSPSIVKIIRNSDVVHFIGYWSFLAILVARVARKSGVPYIVSPAGALRIFGRSSFLKLFFNFFFGKKFMSNASGWVAITHNELAEFEKYGVSINKVKIIPNGVSEADFIEDNCKHFDTSGLFNQQFILFVGRLNYIKGPDLLLEAFIEIANDFPGVNLVFAGPDEGMRDFLYKRALDADLLDRVNFVGYISGAIKSKAYRAALLLVVPSRLEAMSIVAIEAGICATPVMMTDRCGLDDIHQVSPSLIVPAYSSAIAIGMKNALSDLHRLKQWGRNWHSITSSKYLWVDIAKKFQTYASSVVESGSR